MQRANIEYEILITTPPIKPIKAPKAILKDENKLKSDSYKAPKYAPTKGHIITPNGGKINKPKEYQ